MNATDQEPRGQRGGIVEEFRETWRQFRLWWDSMLIGKTFNWFWFGLDRICFWWYLPIKLLFIYLVPWIVWRPLMYFLAGETRPTYFSPVLPFLGVHRLPAIPGGALNFDVWIGAYLFFLILAFLSFTRLPARGLVSGRVQPTVWRGWWGSFFILLITASTPWK